MELEVLLDVVPELEDVGMLPAEAEEFVLVEVPDLVLVVLSDGRGTFIFMMEYMLVVSAAMTMKSLPLMARMLSIFEIFLRSRGIGLIKILA